MKQSRFGLTAMDLRLIALGCMLQDHLWGTIVPGNNWMTHLGRLAFPIFAFQVVEGYHHTRNFDAYCRRLLIFALISELPFNLMLTGSWVFPFHQNVMVTLLLGLLAIRQIDLLSAASGRERIGPFWKLALILLGGVLTFPDYGLLGILNIIAFHLARGKAMEKPIQLLSMVAIHWFGYEGLVYPLFGGLVNFPAQGFAIAALIPIWLYNGEKGRGGKLLQYGSYLFYPVHMLILGLLQIG